MNNLKPLKWHEQQGWFSTKSPLTEYQVALCGEKYRVLYTKRSDGFAREATGFVTADDAKEWCWNHYNEKMQPYVKPSHTWIDASKQLPKEDGEYLALIKGFTYEMGNLDDLQPRIGKWNGGRGCFNEDYGNVLFVAWMPIPEFSEVTK